MIYFRRLLRDINLAEFSFLVYSPYVKGHIIVELGRTPGNKNQPGERKWYRLMQTWNLSQVAQVALVLNIFGSGKFFMNNAKKVPIL